MVTFNVGAFAFENESDLSESTSSVEYIETSSSSSENDPVDSFTSLTEHQQLCFLLALIFGSLLAVAFNFWKW